MAHAPAFPVSIRMRRLSEFLAAVFMIGAATLVQAGNLPGKDRFSGHEQLVAETHAASLKLREASSVGPSPGRWVGSQALGETTSCALPLSISTTTPTKPTHACFNGYKNLLFASNGKAFAGVKFLDGGHQWDKTRTIASPARFTGPADTGRILLHAGDLSSHDSFARFRKILPACPLVVTDDKVDHRFGEGSQQIEMFRYDLSARKSFSLPRINGTSIDLQPVAVYQSPFLNGVSNSDRITVTVGPIRQILDFASEP